MFDCLTLLLLYVTCFAVGSQPATTWPFPGPLANKFPTRRGPHFSAGQPPVNCANCKVSFGRTTSGKSPEARAWLVAVPKTEALVLLMPPTEFRTAFWNRSSEVVSPCDLPLLVWMLTYWPSTRRSTSPTEHAIGLLRASGRDDPVSVRVGGGYRDLLQRVPDQPSED